MPIDLAVQLRGKPLDDIVREKTNLLLDCEACGHRAVWPWPIMKLEEKLKPYLEKPLTDLAPKLRCVQCKEQQIYLRPFLESEWAKPK